VEADVARDAEITERASLSELTMIQALLSHNWAQLRPDLLSIINVNCKLVDLEV
jgi:hypothetical protein